MYCIISRSDRLLSSASIRPWEMALLRTASTSMPRPSSANWMTISLPSRCTSRVIRPLRSLPDFRRVDVVSIPWSTALRNICSSGDVMRSRMVLSISSSALTMVNSTDLLSSLAVWRTIRSRRGVKRVNGTIREFIKPSCSSVWVRDNCSSRLSLSRVFSNNVWLISTKSEADSVKDLDSWFKDEYWSISRGSKSSLSMSSSSIWDRICASSSISIRRSWSAKRCTVVPISSILFVRLLIPISIRARLIADSPDKLIMCSIKPPEIRIISLLLALWSSSWVSLSIDGISLMSFARYCEPWFSLAIKIASRWACRDSLGIVFRLSGFLPNCSNASINNVGVGGLTCCWRINTASASQSWLATSNSNTFLVAGRRLLTKSV